MDAVRFEQPRRTSAARGASRRIADGAAQRSARALARRPARRRRRGAVRARPRSGRLEELHLRAIELAIDAELAAGRHGDVIGRARGADRRAPLHERFHAQRMLALYRAGRQSEALEAYREAHRTLTEEIGVEPGPELRRLQEQILAQDPALDAPAPSAGATASSSRAARRCSPGASASCAGCASAGRRPSDGRVAWRRLSGARPGSARPGSSPSSRPRSSAPGRRFSTPAAPAPPTPP